MDDKFEKKLIVPAGYLATACVLAGFTAFSMFVVDMARRAIYAFAGWTYESATIAQTLRLEGDKGLLSMDRSFLFVVGGVATFYVGMQLEGFIQWAKRTPEDREEYRAQKAAKKHAIEKAERARLQLLADEKAARKASRKPMSGWKRLWIVLSVLFGSLAAITSWHPTRTQYVVVGEKIPMNAEEFEKIPAARLAVNNCLQEEYTARFAYGRDEYRTYRLECPDRYAVLKSLLWFLVPAFFMAAVGLTVRWIYRGFRPKPMRSDDHQP